MSLDDRLKRGIPRLAAETDPDVEPALQRVVSGGRRRKTARLAVATVSVVAVAASAALATPRVIEALRPDPVPVQPADTPGEAPVPEPTGTGTVIPATDCGRTVPFSPGYLPEGFSNEMRLGPAPGATPAEDGQLVVHWTDGERAFEVRNPGTLFVELAQEDDAPTITVLGRETADFGPIVPMEEDYIVQFQVEPAKGDCSLWSLNEYGISLEELKLVAEGLVPA
jgi:hypothetical protein